MFAKRNTLHEKIYHDDKARLKERLHVLDKKWEGDYTS